MAAKQILARVLSGFIDGENILEPNNLVTAPLSIIKIFKDAGKVDSTDEAVAYVQSEGAEPIEIFGKGSQADADSADAARAAEAELLAKQEAEAKAKAKAAADAKAAKEAEDAAIAKAAADAKAASDKKDPAKTK